MTFEAWGALNTVQNTNKLPGQGGLLMNITGERDVAVCNE